MASLQNIGLNYDKIKVENALTSPKAEMSKDAFPTPPNKTPPAKESYWFAHGGTEDHLPGYVQLDSKPGDAKEQQLQKDKEERMRIFREHQEEERLKKLKELEQQFMMSKKHREQLEEERRRRIEEARAREIERRHQVEERKRQIWEAEQERKEAILRRNMEREARIEARRNAQRNSQCFAFGSSTPRTFDLDLAAIGVGRNINQSAVLMSSVSGRRSEERELGPPRATSACSLDRKFGDDCMSRSMVSLSSSTFRGRKRTDILPTLTRERSITPHITPRGKDTSRSPSRPQSSMSGTSEISATSSSVSAVNMRVRPAPRRPRPISVAGSIADSSVHSLVRKEFEKPPVPDRNVASNSTQKPDRAKSASREKADIKPQTVSKKPVPPPKSSEVLARAKSHPVPTKDNLRRVPKSSMNKPNEESKSSVDLKVKLKTNSVDKIECMVNSESGNKSSVSDSEGKQPTPLTSPTADFSSDDSKVSLAGEIDSDSISQSMAEVENKFQNVNISSYNSETVRQETSSEQTIVEKNSDIPTETIQQVEKSASVPPETNEVETPNKDLTSSKPRITSEEEARAALAEKRRLAREQAEREAELERQRLEEIRKQEEEQRRLEEAEQKRMEEEQIRLAELHRQLEEEKLRKAIEEQAQREQEEQERKEEEARQKAERDEQERKAREEAEKQRIELEEKLRKEEEERAERKRRVEQIMARTRGKMAQSPSGSLNESNSKSIKNSIESPSNNSERIVEDKNATSTSSINDVEQVFSSKKEESVVEKVPTNNGMTENNFSSSNTWSSSVEENQTTKPLLPDLLNSETIANHTAKTNGQYNNSEEQLSKISVSNSVTMLSSNGILSANVATSPQSNGYSSHEEMSCTTSPEENSDTGMLIDIQSCQQKSTKISPVSSDFTKLVDLEPPSLDNNINNENFLINVDNLNSNLLNTGNSFGGFDDSLQKKQDTPVADLLS